MGNVNRFNLKRAIGADIARSVRQECGFGCVICGHEIYQYEHFEPEFKDCKEHTVKGIALLCPNHHAETTAKRLTKRQIKKARQNPINLDPSRRRPSNLRHGLFLDETPTVRFGSAVIKGPFSIVQGTTGIPLIEVLPPAEEGSPWRLSALFIDKQSKPVFLIYENECVVIPSAWDYEYVGNTITIKNGLRNIALKLEIKPQTGEVIFHRTNLRVFNYNITVKKDLQVKDIVTKKPFFHLGGTINATGGSFLAVLRGALSTNVLHANFLQSFSDINLVQDILHEFYNKGLTSSAHGYTLERKSGVYNLFNNGKPLSADPITFFRYVYCLNYPGSSATKWPEYIEYVRNTI